MSELQNAADPARGPGPWFIAARPGACSDCGESFEEGDTIRADGWGSWEGRYCCNDKLQNATEPAPRGALRPALRRWERGLIGDDL